MTTPSSNESLTRRDVLKRAAVGSLAIAASSVNSVLAAQDKSQPLRVIAYNVYNCTGWPKDRALGKKATALGQMPDRFAHELALYDPDIINFSESPSEEVVKQIAERLGMNYVRFPSGGNWPGTLLSRFEIVDPKNAPLLKGERPKDLFTRHWGQATVKLPNGESLVVHSAHLHPSPEPDTRLREIPLMLESMKKDLDADRSMLLIGDLNHTPDTNEYKLWIDAGWTDTFTQVGKGDGLTIKADTPDRRIDYVMAAGPIGQKVVESRPLFEGAFRTNTADAASFALSDHLPQLAIFE
ncbi:endonuclease/exonuclease/phosphatase family protein [Bremerella sp. P1]|uniref:endonuclease/exonuclease/phosphatase family protein n=1 Tax=Bremerella sp. P1 TaxID=3026424 RepID=UPI0023689F0E|nr:endonuclease/exonuclease/phosphatase family protein [Bremerella sp. P1]WDI43405.1 endonuclease/exonuclease/phosphatase family protein [Bremerella sp. P1]